MRALFLVLSTIFVLSACSLLPASKTSNSTLSTETGETNSASGGNLSGVVQDPLVETLSGKVNDYYPIFDGTGTKIVHVYHTSGTPTKVSFMNHDANSMIVSLDFLDDTNPNLRLSRIIMPDGTMDGPFGVKTEYNIEKKGGYELIFNENQMAGDPWSGVVDISITLSDTSFPESPVILK